MASIFPRAKFYTLTIFVSVLITQGARGTLAARRVEMPGPSFLFEYVVFATVVGCWFEVDSRENHFLRVWDQGFLVAVGFPLVLPYYLIKTRGWKRGIRTILAFVFFYYLTYLGAAILCAIFR